jgi:hypothetical protein
MLMQAAFAHAEPSARVQSLNGGVPSCGLGGSGSGLPTRPSILAADTGLKAAPKLMEHFTFIESPIWGFAPLALLIIGSLILIAKNFGWLGRDAAISSPVSLSSTTLPVSMYVADLEEEALDKPEYNQLVAFCIDHLLPTCWAQIELQESIIRNLCKNEQVAGVAIDGLHKDSRAKISGFWNNFWNLQSGLLDSPGPTIKFEGMIECIYELEREYYKNFCDEGIIRARAAGLGMIGLFWSQHHQQMIKSIYEQIKRDIRFGKLHRLRPSRWGEFDEIDFLS